MFKVEPGGGKRSLARASVSTTLRTACAGATVGAEGAAADAGLSGLPPRAASKKAFCAESRASGRVGETLLGAGGQGGGRMGWAMAPSCANHLRVKHG
jgi:hypothetical protein